MQNEYKIVPCEFLTMFQVTISNMNVARYTENITETVNQDEQSKMFFDESNDVSQLSMKSRYSFDLLTQSITEINDRPVIELL